MIYEYLSGERAWPSQRGISEVGLLWLLSLMKATLVQGWPGAPKDGGVGAEDVRDNISEFALSAEYCIELERLLGAQQLLSLIHI